ncbi:hypothetical protein Trydic_g5021 [Trypoxylus dichotomus]
MIDKLAMLIRTVPEESGLQNFRYASLLLKGGNANATRSPLKWHKNEVNDLKGCYDARRDRVILKGFLLYHRRRQGASVRDVLRSDRYLTRMPFVQPSLARRLSRTVSPGSSVFDVVRFRSDSHVERSSSTSKEIVVQILNAIWRKAIVNGRTSGSV